MRIGLHRYAYVGEFICDYTIPNLKKKPKQSNKPKKITKKTPYIPTDVLSLSNIFLGFYSF